MRGYESAWSTGPSWAARTVLGAALVLGAAAPGQAFSGLDDKRPTTYATDAVHPRAGATDAPVGVQVVFVVDASKSVNDDEFRIELGSMAQALRSEDVEMALFGYSKPGSMAVSLIAFGHIAKVRIPWFDVRDRKGLRLFADMVENLPRDIVGRSTNIAAALDLSANALEHCPWPSSQKRRVIDLVGDGRQNGTINGKKAVELLEDRRNRLVAIGATINSFAILNEDQDLKDYFDQHLISKYDQMQFPDGDDGDGYVADLGFSVEVAQLKDGKDRLLFQKQMNYLMRRKISWEVSGHTPNEQEVRQAHLEAQAASLPNRL